MTVLCIVSLVYCYFSPGVIAGLMNKILILYWIIFIYKYNKKHNIKSALYNSEKKIHLLNWFIYIFSLIITIGLIYYFVI